MDALSITKIQTTKKGRHALFCNGEFLFSIDDDTLMEFSVHEGMPLDERQIQSLRQRTDYQRAKSKAFELLSSRAHSKKELTDKLTARYDGFTAESVVLEIGQMGYLDDEGYAKDCVDYVISSRLMSCKAALRYLTEKGIDRLTAENALEGYSAGDGERLKLIIKKRYAEKILHSEGRRQTFAALARLGFSLEDIKETLAIFDDALTDGEI